MPQRRIPDKFRVPEETKEEQSLTFFDFIPWYMKNVYRLRELFKGSIKLDKQ